MIKHFDVKGMTCAACQGSVERSVKNIKGVKNVEVYLLSNSMKVEYDETVTSDTSIVFAVENAGYSASIKGKVKQNSYALELKKMKKEHREKMQKIQNTLIKNVRIKRVLKKLELKLN